MSQITFPSYDIEELANTMMALLDGWEDKWVGWIKLFKLLLEGKPVPQDRIAAYLHRTQKEVADLLEEFTKPAEDRNQDEKKGEDEKEGKR